MVMSKKRKKSAVDEPGNNDASAPPWSEAASSGEVNLGSGNAINSTAAMLSSTVVVTDFCDSGVHLHSLNQAFK